MTRISYILPTRNRPERLHDTLRALGDLAAHDAEVIVVDNASDRPVTAPRWLGNGLPVTLLRREDNLGAAARNEGAAASDAASAWLVMLDDDSYPVDIGWVHRLARHPADVLAVSADIHLPRMGCREAGGLPEVIVGCGAAVRRDAFLHSGGYDPSFGYYAEEYDLCARLLLAGGRIEFDHDFRVEHHKVAQGRNMDEILYRLMRNNGWVAERYAPSTHRRSELREIRSRYRAIGRKEHAEAGARRGLLELRQTRAMQRRSPLPPAVWARFTGLEAARRALRAAWRELPFASACLVERGKNAHVIEAALAEMGVRLAAEDVADVLVIGTMSPGPMLDAFGQRRADARRVIAPWLAAIGGTAAPAIIEFKVPDAGLVERVNPAA